MSWMVRCRYNAHANERRERKEMIKIDAWISLREVVESRDGVKVFRLTGTAVLRCDKEARRGSRDEG